MPMPRNIPYTLSNKELSVAATGLRYLLGQERLSHRVCDALDDAEIEALRKLVSDIDAMAIWDKKTPRVIFRVRRLKTGVLYTPGYTDRPGAEGFISYLLSVDKFAKPEDFAIEPFIKE